MLRLTEGQALHWVRSHRAFGWGDGFSTAHFILRVEVSVRGIRRSPMMDMASGQGGLLRGSIG